MPAPRGEVAGAVLGGRLYVAGGLGLLGATVATFDAYDPVADQWAELAPLPAPRDHLGIAALGGRIYVAGGGILGAAGVRPEAWMYDPRADRWSAIAPMPAGRKAFALVPLNVRLYAVGGVVRGADPTSVDVYDPATNAWRSDVAPLPAPREHVAGAAFDGRVWLIAGRWAGDLATVASYDPATDAWASAPNLPLPRGGLTAAVLDGRIHATGGESVSGTFSEHEVFDPGAGTWSLWPDLPNHRHGLASGVVGNDWIVAGGGRSPNLSVSDVVDIFRDGP